MQGEFLIIGSIVILVIIALIVIIEIIKKVRFRFYRNKVKDLEIQRNVVASTPVLLELSRVEPIIKNDRMEEKYNRWQDRFNNLKENRLSQIDDMLIDLDLFVDKRDYKSCGYRIAKIEIEIYKVRESADHLLNEIKNLSKSEEKYRSSVIKLKTKYRKLNNDFQNHRQLYEDMQEAIEMQLENIEKRFLDFEKVMDTSDYPEVVHITKALYEMIDHMEIIINEMPDVLVMARQALPNRIKEVKQTYDEMVNSGYPLDYLNIDYNIEESKKNIDLIIDKAKVLNLEGCMFDLKTMSDYYDAIFIDFEKERLSRKAYEELSVDFGKRIEGTNNLVKDVYAQLDDIKNMYDLSDGDLNIIDEVNKVLVVINDDYNKMLAKVESESSPFSQVNEELENLMRRLSLMEDDFDVALKSLGNMYEDEQRAREQLEEIKGLLRQCKYNIRSFKLPVITDNYFVELSEASEAIQEVVKELEKTPIVIKVLNTRVDTARDLVLKLYNTTNNMIMNARYAEMMIVYGNRYRDRNEEISSRLDLAEAKFNRGEYKNSLDISLSAVSLVDKNIDVRFFGKDEI
ncbi:MAG: septation ring formation regulator EzrA [Bacilli bacterium]|nr:septation ring formation regulator EzrA [Bacilli bacterium]